MSKVKSTMDLQIHNLESHFKAQFMRRIEILEDAIDTTVNRIDKFMNQMDIDTSKQQKIE